MPTTTSMSTRTTLPRNRDERLRVFRSRRWRSRGTSAISVQAPRRAPGSVEGSSLGFPKAATPSKPTEPTKRLLTLDETAKILRVGRTTAWEMVNSGDLSAIRLRGKLLVPCDELERYLAELIEDARTSAAARRSVRRKPRALRSARG